MFYRESSLVGDHEKGVGKIKPQHRVTHSSILAWEILWTEETGGLQSMGSQRVEHNLATEHKLECHSRSPGKSLSIFIHHINVNRLEIGS